MTTSKRKRPALSKAQDPDRGSRYECRTCGSIFMRYAWAEDHVNTVHQGGAIRFVLPPGGAVFDAHDIPGYKGEDDGVPEGIGE